MASYRSSAVAEVRWSDTARELDAVSSTKPRAVASLERGSRMRAVMRAQMRSRSATSTGEQIREAEMAQGPQDSGDMAMRKGAADLEGLITGDQIFTFQDAT